jgi:hypothetical protein
VVAFFIGSFAETPALPLIFQPHGYGGGRGFGGCRRRLDHQLRCGLAGTFQMRGDFLAVRLDGIGARFVEGLGQGDGKLLVAAADLDLAFFAAVAEVHFHAAKFRRVAFGGDGDPDFLPGANGARLDLDGADAARFGEGERGSEGEGED